jgi:hypothetical protein
MSCQFPNICCKETEKECITNFVEPVITKIPFKVTEMPNGKCPGIRCVIDNEYGQE